jgi:hypothetical protein
MIDVLICVLLVTFATKAVLDAWFEGSVFAIGRAYAEAWKSSDKKITSLLGELLSCRFCLGYHVSFLLSITCCAFISNWLLIFLITFAARGMEYEINRLLEAKYDSKE